MTATPAAPARQDLTPDELLEWHDLQDAQMTALEQVWDNPRDECWNDVPCAGDNSAHWDDQHASGVGPTT